MKPKPNAKQRGKTTVAKIEQPHGGALNSGGTPGNSGGKPGRSGRKSEEVRLELGQLRDSKARAVLEGILDGAVTYQLDGLCEHCGKHSRGDSIDDAAKRIPSPDVR